MICIIALVISGILGIFSATHRKIASEATNCILKKVRLKPCESGLDTRLKTKIVGKLMRRNQKIANFTFKYFNILSFVFVILMIFSFVYSGIVVYNLAVHGDCRGASDDQGSCVFNSLIGKSCPSDCADCLFEKDCKDCSCDKAGCENAKR